MTVHKEQFVYFFPSIVFEPQCLQHSSLGFIKVLAIYGILTNELAVASDILTTLSWIQFVLL